MALNETVMARNSILDAFALRFAYQDSDIAIQRYNRIMALFAEWSGWTDDKVRSYVKYNIISSGKRNGTKLEAFFVGGKLARVADPAWLSGHLRNLTELHLKFYLIDREESSYESYVTRYANAGSGKYATAVYRTAGNRGRSEHGTRNVAIARGSADLHLGVRKYRGERAAVEGHVKGKVLRTVIDNVLRRHEGEHANRTPGALIREVQSEAAYQSAKRYCSANRSREIVLTDYFVGVSPISWVNPLHDTRYDELDPEQERQGAAFGELEGYIGTDPRQEPLGL